MPEPARVTETVSPGAAVPVSTSVLSAVTPSPAERRCRSRWQRSTAW